jgi:hypothetical protein
MGLLEWLMFWKNDEPDGDSYEVEGCFTLPTEVDPDTDAGLSNVANDCVPDLTVADGNPAAEA